jgi:hypothetical protein
VGCAHHLGGGNSVSHFRRKSGQHYGKGHRLHARLGTLLWLDGDFLAKTIFFDLPDDQQLGEGDRTVNLTLSDPTGGATLSDTTTATVTIAEDADVPATIQFSAPTIQTVEGHQVRVSVTRGASAVGPVTVSWSLGGGAADAGADYTPTSGTLLWADGDSTPRMIFFDVPDDRQGGPRVRTPS